MISNRILNLESSATLAVAARVAEMRAAGIDVIGLTLGEPDFATPDHIKEAAKKAVDENFSHYGPVPGYEWLRKAICKKLKDENGLDYQPNQIVVSTGAKQAICNTVLALVNPGDEVILPTPCWVSYAEMVKLAEGVNVMVPTTYESGYKLTAAQLEAAITPRTRLLMLCSPNNPTGSIYSREELAALAVVLERHPEIYIISDEIYEHLNYVGRHYSLAEYDALKERVIIINGVSKAYAMTGYRIGWQASSVEVANACKKLQGQYTSCSCSVAEKAVEAAYLGPQDCVEEMRQAFDRRRHLVCELAAEIPGLEFTMPEGAFYLFPRVKKYFGKSYGGKTMTCSMDIVEFLLNEGHVATVAGSAFGDDDCIRLSYATDENTLREALRRMKETLAKLQ
mgnify:CR=1 FL=1